MRRVVANLVASIVGVMAAACVVAVGCNAEILLPARYDTGTPTPDIDPNHPFDDDTGLFDVDASIVTPDYDASCHREVGIPDFDGYDDPTRDYLPPDDCNAGVDAATFDAPLYIPGSRFCEIYRDIIHHDGDAKCQSHGCHGGDVGMNGLSMGWTRARAYEGLTTFKTCASPPRDLLVRPLDGGSTFFISLLPVVVEPPHGFMPPTDKPWIHVNRLTEGDIRRVNAWLDRGAPFD